LRSSDPGQPEQGLFRRAHQAFAAQFVNLS
jgi:hypothetical protein